MPRGARRRGRDGRSNRRTGPGHPPGPSRGGTEERLRRLRRAEDKATSVRLILATMRLKMRRGTWTAAFTARHPTLRIEALNRTDVTTEISVSDYWISGGAPGEWAAEIASYPDVLHVDSMAALGDGCLYRLKYRNPPIIALYRRLKLPLQFPLRMQAGVVTWEVVARQNEFKAVLDYMRGADAGVQITSVRRRPLWSHLPALTDAQHQLLTEALSAGYFAVPRGITLTDLAKKLDRSKSSVSVGIALIEKKLVESALSAGTLG